MIYGQARGNQWMRTVGERANEFRHYFLSAPQRTVTEGSTRPEPDIRLREEMGDDIR